MHDHRTGQRSVGTRRFDLAVIDEACQSVEPDAGFAVALRSRGAGRRSPPVAADGGEPEAAAQGFAVSLFERLITLYGPSIARRLTVQ